MLINRLSKILSNESDTGISQHMKKVHAAHIGHVVFMSCIMSAFAPGAFHVSDDNIFDSIVFASKFINKDLFKSERNYIYDHGLE